MSRERRSTVRWTPGPLAVAIASAAMLSACGSASDATTAIETIDTVDAAATGAAATSVAADSAAPATVVTPAPGAPQALRFTAPLVGGGELDMATLADKPVLMWFWAPY